MNFRKIHLYLGILLSIPLALTVSTGLFLAVFSENLHNLAFTQDHLDSLLSHIHKESPQLQIQSMAMAPHSSNRVEIRVLDTKTQEKQLLTVDSQTGALLEQTETSANDWKAKAYQLHRGTWGGLPGRILMTCLGIWMSLLWPSGWIIRRNRMKVLRPQRAQSLLNNSLGYHRILGSSVGIWITFMALTGSFINFKQEITRQLDPVPALPHRRGVSVFPTNLKKQIAAVMLTQPRATLESIHFLEGGSLILFYFQDTSRIYMNAENSHIEKLMGPRTHWIHTIYPLHSGHFLGKARELSIIIFGILTFLTLGTGLALTRQGRIYLSRVQNLRFDSSWNFSFKSNSRP